VTADNTRLGEPQRLVVRRVEVLEDVSVKPRDQISLTYLGVGDEVVGVGAVEVESDKVVPAITRAGGYPVLIASAELQAERAMVRCVMKSQDEYTRVDSRPSTDYHRERRPGSRSGYSKAPGRSIAGAASRR
jgi:hypothetical protein